MLVNRLAPIAGVRRMFTAHRTEDMYITLGFWTEDILTGIKGRVE